MRLGEYFEIGKRMKQVRTNAGISQRDMAGKLELSSSAYSNYENGYSEPPVEIVLEFCDILGTTLDDLFQIHLNRETIETLPEAKPTGAYDVFFTPEDGENVYFHLKDSVHEFKISLNTLLECLKFASQEQYIPPLSTEWLAKLGK